MPMPRLPDIARADNFANPLVKNGFVESIEPFLDGVLISFDFDHPASKLVALEGVIFNFGGGTYVTGFELDSAHGFAHCKPLS